tara:strand:+ start:704 stop:1042 length:339 start_codon:yes stop_codon:yes gene_type:complete
MTQENNDFKSCLKNICCPIICPLVMIRALICCWFSNKTIDITIVEPNTTNTTNATDTTDTTDTTDQNVNKLSIITEESDDENDGEIPYRTPSITKDKNLQKTNYRNNINRFL